MLSVFLFVSGKGSFISYALHTSHAHFGGKKFWRQNRSYFSVSVSGSSGEKISTVQSVHALLCRICPDVDSQGNFEAAKLPV